MDSAFPQGAAHALPTAQHAATATIEEYLETIYNITMEGEPVIGARLADKFRVAPPTVTETLKRMTRDGYIEMDSRRQITLTPLGVERAEAVLRRHRLTERFLVDMLGMPWHQVHEEACRLEHYISGAVEARVLASLDQPTTCPHGNPIPSPTLNARTYLSDLGAQRLLLTAPGEPQTIVCVSEVVEDEEELISYLHDRGLTPGTQVTLAAEPPTRDASASADAPVELLAGERPVTVSAHAAHALWVRRAEA
ncbi:MAG TPA: metal-dependent transcriptional regulator [Ktedonobacterales bacterium]